MKDKTLIHIVEFISISSVVSILACVESQWQHPFSILLIVYVFLSGKVGK